ncbi:multidrug efflux SMR transporter [Amylibacter sp. IMCC11727]|uniref:DMT family transporter n=1 Tax=Amylibacter sp. IMCC11727 TaxID=3039851 RepID=UPI00244DB3D3|nr:multidrug efflux SMR transporter [Amylibacter sp. IMCC11727]WGI20890.1 multidrug efflux SMR transporter [Amylibacter sp. IMCC11727]
MAWFVLFVSGALEVVWASAMKESAGFTKVGPSILTGVTAFLGFWLLAYAMKSLPLGTAYPVWVGIGAVGTFVFGVIWFNEPASLLRVGSVTLIVAGIVGLKVAS